MVLQLGALATGWKDIPGQCVLEAELAAMGNGSHACGETIKKGKGANMVGIQAVQDKIETKQMLEEHPLSLALVPSALADELVGQIEGLMSTIETLQEVSASHLPVTNGSRATRGILVKKLTYRQLEVLSLMAEGYPNLAIAEKLVLNPKSVENYINSIYRSLNLSKESSTVLRVRAVLEYIDYTLWWSVNVNRAYGETTEC